MNIRYVTIMHTCVREQQAPAAKGGRGGTRARALSGWRMPCNVLHRIVGMSFLRNATHASVCMQLHSIKAYITGSGAPYPMSVCGRCVHRQTLQLCAHFER